MEVELFASKSKINGFLNFFEQSGPEEVVSVVNKNNIDFIAFDVIVQ